MRKHTDIQIWVMLSLSQEARMNRLETVIVKELKFNKFFLRVRVPTYVILYFDVKTTRDRTMEVCKAHNLEVAGSNPAPAKLGS